MTDYARWPVPKPFKSDGCTLPWFLVFLAPLFAPYKSACRWHDWARRHLVYYGVLTVQQADNAFRLYMIDLGASRAFARLAWFWVKVTRSRFRRTHHVPDPAWIDYVFPPQRRRSDTDAR